MIVIKTLFVVLKNVFSLPAVRENRPTVFPCCSLRRTGVPDNAFGVIGLRFEGDAAEFVADNGGLEKAGKAVRVTSAAFAAPRGWPLALTTQRATLCW